MSRRQIVYVANADSNDITVLALDGASGGLDEVERFAAGGSVMPLAAPRDGRVLHASIRSEPFRVASLAIDAKSGALRSIGTASLPGSSCWLAMDRSDRFLLSAAYGASVVGVNPIGADGAAGEPLQTVHTQANAHSIQADPANRFAFAACLGGGVVRQMRFDAATGRLSDHEPPFWSARPGAGPRHFVFHPALPVVYLLHELDASIEVLAFDAARGNLTATGQVASALPPGFGGGAPWAADIHLTPDGRFLYASERRSSTLASFAVDAVTGALTLLGFMPTETEPRGFAITPDGRFLVAVGQASNRLSRYAVDAGTGALAKLGDQPVGRNPNWVQIVELPG